MNSLPLLTVLPWQQEQHSSSQAETISQPWGWCKLQGEGHKAAALNKNPPEQQKHRNSKEPNSVFLFAELTTDQHSGVPPSYYLLALNICKGAPRHLTIAAPKLQIISKAFTHQSPIQACHLLLLSQLWEVPWLDQYPLVCLCLKQKETEVKGEHTGDKVKRD